MTVKKISRKQKESERPRAEYALMAADSYAADDSEMESEEGSDDEDNFSEPEVEDERAGVEKRRDVSEETVEDSAEDDSDLDSQEVQAGNEEAALTTRKHRELSAPPSAAGEQCTFDLRNLVAVNSHQVNIGSLYKTTSKKLAALNGNLTIKPDRLSAQIDEDLLLEKASDGCAQLINALWQLPTEKSDAGPMVHLPSYFEIQTPRALPPPPPKKETKWEKFAKDRGIPLHKEKRSRKVWDEATGTWMYRHGYQKANNDAAEWPIMEVKANEDPYEDPWEKIRESKRSRVEKNMENRMRNQERAGNLSKGTATRAIKHRENSRKAGTAGGNMDRDYVAPSGVPVDLKPSKASGPIDSKKRGKESTVAALRATQVSTASLGKFDKMREGEPERKKAQASLKKRKFESATGKKVVSGETERGIKVLKNIIAGGGSAKERSRRNGTLAKGETAYDYEFDDGLGASSFRKKKGRAGAGKMKKMTKKRAK